jgi:hypothetical protein
VVALQTSVHELEPVCVGKPLGYWLYRNLGWAPDDRSNLDTNAIPFLVLALKKRDTFTQRTYQLIFPKFPSWIKHHVPEPRAASLYRANAITFLRLLALEQPSAAPLISCALAQALQTNEDPVVRFRSAEVLTLLARNDAQVASIFCHALTTEKDAKVRAYLVYQLRYFEQQPTIVVPALIERLSDNDAQVRARAAESLLAFTASAKMAVPILMQALNDESPEVRRAANQVLKELQPEPNAMEGEKRQ